MKAKDSQSGALCVWLASPDAAARFDPRQQSPFDAARWSTLRAPSRRLDWATSRALLAHLAGQRLEHASLAHSGGWCAALTPSAGLRVGVDIELVRRRDELALARWAYAECEWTALAALHGTQRQRHFYALWTLKEACAKALGLGLLVAMRECVFRCSDGQWEGRVPTRDPWQAWVLAPRSELVLSAVCIGGPVRNVTMPGAMEWPQQRTGDWEPIGHVMPEPGARG